MRPKPTAITALLALSVAAAGCGGDGVDKKTYIRDVGNIQQRTTGDAALQTSDMVKATTPADVARELRELGSSIETNAGALGKIEAPDEVASVHRQYVERLTRFGKDLEALAGQVEKADAKTTNALLRRASGLTKSLATDEAGLVKQLNDGLR